jgi:hypothetical protein
MIKINLCNDRALVTSPCLRVRFGAFELHMWLRGWCPRAWAGRVE